MLIDSKTSLIVFTIAHQTDLGEQMRRTEYGRTRFEIGSVHIRRQMSNGMSRRPDSSTCRKPLCLQLLNKGERLHRCAAEPSADAKGILLSAEGWYMRNRQRRNGCNDARGPFEHRGWPAHVPRSAVIKAADRALR